MERKAHHRKKDVGKREKEATNIRSKKWMVKESGDWREKYIIKRRTSVRERRKRQLYEAMSGRCKEVVNREKSTSLKEGRREEREGSHQYTKQEVEGERKC